MDNVLSFQVARESREALELNQELERIDLRLSQMRRLKSLSRPQLDRELSPFRATLLDAAGELADDANALYSWVRRRFD